ncbi:MAG: MFS transporter [Eubacteriales bacterium]|nr:MFS transporter [Eubacteriales bacterium]
MNSRTKRYIAITALGLVYGTMFNLPYIKYVFYDAMIEGMGVTNTQLGLLLTVYTIISTIGLIPGGWIADRFKTKKIIVGSAFLNGFICFFFMFTMKSYACAMITWIVSAVAGVTAFWAAILKAVRVISPSEEQGRAFGFWEGVCGVSATIGNFVALYAFSVFDDSAAALRGAVASMGVMCVIGAVLVWWLYDEHLTSTDETGEKKKAPGVKEMLQVFRLPKMYLCCLIVFCSYGFFSSQTFLTPYFTNVLGAAVTFSGVLAIFRSYGLKILGGPIGGVIADKLESPSKLAVGCYILMSASILYIETAAGGSGLIPVLTVLTLALATVCFMARGTMWATIDEAGIPPEISGTAISIVSIIGFNIPDTFLPPLLGSWLDKYGNQGYHYIFYFLIGLCCVGIVAALAMITANRKGVRHG